MFLFNVHFIVFYLCNDMFCMVLVLVLSKVHRGLKELIGN